LWFVVLNRMRCCAADAGDTHLVLACLLEVEPVSDFWSADELKSLSFAASRSLLLLRMFACALQVIQFPHRTRLAHAASVFSVHLPAAVRKHPSCP
jgi:hypothetical protein